MELLMVVALIGAVFAVVYLSQRLERIEAKLDRLDGLSKPWSISSGASRGPRRK